MLPDREALDPDGARTYYLELPEATRENEVVTEIQQTEAARFDLKFHRMNLQFQNQVCIHTNRTW